MARVIKAVAILVLAMASGCHLPWDATHPIGFHFVTHDCPPVLAKANARCGYVAVPEDYSKRGSRTINLNVVVLNSLEPGAAMAAQYDLEGGPGFAVTDSAAFYATDGAMYRTHRDVVLADMRGTGGSAGLFCPNIAQHEKENPGTPFYPPALVRDCAQLLSAKADLRQYTTAAAARDIDSVRRALGYQRLDLNALSYGTTLALRYMRDFPDHVRSAVLTGTAPASRMPPRNHAMAAERALKLLFQICAADPACSTMYPNPAADLKRATERLDAEARDVFLEKIRTMLYLPGTARRVPSVLRKAADGDFQMQAGDAGRSFADGLYLSITCSESLAMMDLDEAIAESDATHFGAYRLRRQTDACRQWPKAAPDRRLLDVTHSDVPALFISGALDPVTPPEWAAETATQFPASRHVIVAQGGHVLEGMSGIETCLDRVVPEFLAKASAASIDTACFDSMEAGPFQ
jgi:pimeloyl-ACP methyl ester carboxylesterase